MSYSRWSNSCWYTYSDVNKVGGEHTLTLCDHWNYPISTLIDCKEAILEDLRQLRFERNPLNFHGVGEAPKDRFVEEEIQELAEIIDDFIADHSSAEARKESK